MIADFKMSTCSACLNTSDGDRTSGIFEPWDYKEINS